MPIARRAKSKKRIFTSLLQNPPTVEASRDLYATSTNLSQSHAKKISLLSWIIAKCEFIIYTDPSTKWGRVDVHTTPFNADFYFVPAVLENKGAPVIII